MRQLSKTIVRVVFLAALSLTSCNQTDKPADQNQAILEKENELLKKENELLKKEQELNQKAAVQTTKQHAPNNAVADNLDFLKGLHGKYPHDVKMLDNPILQKRLEKMLGSQYDFMKSVWDVETPIEIKDGLFYAWGMQAHSGGDPGAVLMADLHNNVLYVGIREDAREELYSEDGSNAPKQLQEWADAQ